jgi:two-component system sensor histidine kinase BarA
MKSPTFFTRSINNRLFILGLLPLILITILLTWQTVASRRAEMAYTLQEVGHQTANYLANIADFALYAGRMDLLQSLATSTSSIPTIYGVGFLDPERRPLVAGNLPELISDADMKRGHYPTQNNDYLFVEQAVYLTGADVTDFEDPPAAAEKTLLGWVIVAVDKRLLQQRLQNTLVTHLVISFFVFMGAALFTYYLSTSLLSPIKHLTRTVKRLEEGDLEARARPSTDDELATLANGINHLASSVAEGREDLEGKIRVATERLQWTLEDLRRKNRELEVARREAEAGSKAKGDFLAQMSHELRTPVTAIQGFVNLLGNTKNLTAAEKRYCLIIHQASLQLLQLIDDILDITRFQSHGITIENAPFNLAECLETPLSLMAPTAQGKGLELILDIAPDVPLGLVGDSMRIRQIVYNLVANAIKFTHKGDITVQIRQVGSGNNPVLTIDVIDTGIGIPEKHRQQIFEAFAQADTSVSRQFGGSGLGLSIVKNLVSLMGGSVDIESTAGRGSIFSVTIPLAQSTDQPRYPGAVYRRVLLYDAHPRSRQALEHLLARFVEEVDSCENRAEVEFSSETALPEIVFYSPHVEENEEGIRLTLQYLRRLFPGSPIVMIAPLQDFHGHADYEGADPHDTLVIDKPPTIGELAGVLSGERGEGGDANAGTPRDLDARILVAEDNEFMRLLLTTYLERCGCRCTLTQNGREAVSLGQRQHFDLILLDVHMPEVSGLEAIRGLRQEGVNRKTPIVMLTADILQQEETALFEAGADELVFKPIEEDRLYKLILRHAHKTLEPGEGPRPAARTRLPREAFVGEVVKLTREARRALDRGDNDLLREALHQLLGVAGVFKAPGLERAVRGLHTAAKKSDEEIIAASMETLVAEVEALEAGLDQPPGDD